MEHKFLIDLTVKYGLDEKQLSKTVDVMYQLGYPNADDKGFQHAAIFLCSQKLYDLPAEKTIEEMKRKGYEFKSAQS